MNSGALLPIARNSAGSKVEIEDIANMQSRLLPQSYQSAIWLANPTVLPQLAVITATALAWLSSDMGLAKPMPTSILGRPLFITEKCQALGTSGDIMLIDPSFYVIGDRKTLELKASEQFKFSSDQTAWRMIERVAGQPWVDSVLTPKHGSTLSPFVVLNDAT